MPRGGVPALPRRRVAGRRTAMGGVKLVASFRPELWRAASPDDALRSEGLNFDLIGIDCFTMTAAQHDAVLWLSGTALLLRLQRLPICRTFRADDGTRTHDLLHGKCERRAHPFAPVRPNRLVPGVFRADERTRANPSER
jgi:hypothetical protein